MARAGRQIRTAVLLGVMAWAAFTIPAAVSAAAARAAAWSAPVRVDKSHLRALSCPSSKFCAAVDGDGRALFYHGSTWTRPAPVDRALQGDDLLLGISCSYKAFCVTFNAQGDVFTYDGHKWHQPSSLWSAGIYEHGQVSCPTTGFCALENGHRLFLYRHGHWSAGPHLNATAVSCSSGRFCVATGTSGSASFASVYRTKWGARRTVDRGSVVRSLSCASSAFCVAAGAKLAAGQPDGGGTAVTYRGRSWSSPRAIDSAPAGPTSLSCPSNKFCAAVDAAGNAVTYDGASWGAAIPIDSRHAHGRAMWVSCPSSSFCMAIDSFGYAVRRRGG